MMAVRIERVVDRHAARRTESLIRLDHRRTAAVGQHKIKRAERAPDRMILAEPHFVQGGGGVDVPEDLQRAWPRMVYDPRNQLVIEYAHPARLDDDVRSASLPQ